MTRQIKQIIIIYDDGTTESTLTDSKPVATPKSTKKIPRVWMRPIEIDTHQYRSIKEAAETLGLSRFMVMARAGDPKFPDWRLL